MPVSLQEIHFPLSCWDCLMPKRATNLCVLQNCRIPTLYNITNQVLPTLIFSPTILIPIRAGITCPHVYKVHHPHIFVVIPALVNVPCPFHSGHRTRGRVELMTPPHPNKSMYQVTALSVIVNKDYGNARKQGANENSVYTKACSLLFIMNLNTVREN